MHAMTKRFEFINLTIFFVCITLLRNAMKVLSVCVCVCVKTCVEINKL